ncbi:reverse transcriptase N-terminal domain-containing protein [Salmonella enterica]|nr:reverse transcriptase N-terminal domain-containing protein [Salmonella enterica]
MTATGQRSGATSASVKWQPINWLAIEQQILRLQMRIAKAMREGRYAR